METIIVYVCKEDIKRWRNKNKTGRALTELINLAEDKPKTVFGYKCDIPIKIIISDRGKK